MSRTMRAAPPTRYQSERVSLAATIGFRTAIAKAAGAALDIPLLSAADRQLLHDLRRDEGRYQFRAVDRLLDLLAKHPSEAVSMEFAVDIRAALVRRRTRARRVDDLYPAVAEETAAQGEADSLTLAVLRDPTPENVARARSALSRHAAAINRLLDDMTVMTPKERQQ